MHMFLLKNELFCPSTRPHYFSFQINYRCPTIFLFKVIITNLLLELNYSKDGYNKVSYQIHNVCSIA
jgi:hypothetical protein